nr:uncharacterized protein LOC106678665 [Halyomorpha halys]
MVTRSQPAFYKDVGQSLVPCWDQLHPGHFPVLALHASKWLAVFLLSGLCSGQDYEEDRLPIRSRNPRGPIVPSRAVKAQAIQKTSTTEAPPLEPEEEEYEDELIEEEPTTTTTEAPKKMGLRGGVLRPFRSNADLIEALKRRRAQAQGGGSSYNSVSSTSTTTTTTESTRQGRKSKGKFSRGSSQRDSSTTEQPIDEQAAPRARAFGGRGRRF